MECKTLYAVWLTDVDNTLLPITRNRDRSHFKLLGEFLRELERHCILVVPVTFKTHSEILYLSSMMGYSFPMAVVEGGCAIIVNDLGDGGHRAGCIELCRGVDYVHSVLNKFDDRFCRDRLVMISRLDVEKASEILNLPADEAVHAQNRRYTEIVYSESQECIDRVARHVELEGLKAVRSRRFLHVTDVLKEEAARIVLDMVLHRVIGPVIASGDNVYDGGFLQLADIPILVSNNAFEWFRRYPYVSIRRAIPSGLIEHVSRLLLLRPL